MTNTAPCPLNCGLPTAHDPDQIIVHGAREHNLKNICFVMPRGKLVALTGPSGSGKSSIATDILQKECIRQYLESLGMVTDHLEKAKVDLITGLSPSIGVTQRVADFNSRSTVGTKSGLLTIFRNLFAAMGRQPCPGCGHNVQQPVQAKHKLVTLETEPANSTKKIKKSYFSCPHCQHQLEVLQMAHFSPNTLAGACEACQGAGEITDVDLARLLQRDQPLSNGGVASWDRATAKYYENVIIAASQHYGFLFDPTLPLRDYTPAQLNFLLYGVNYPAFAAAYQHRPAPKKVSAGYFEGLVPQLLKLYQQNPTTTTQQYILRRPCTACGNLRLGRLGRTVTVNAKTIIDIAGLNLNDLYQWVCDLEQQVSADELAIVTALAGALKDRLTHLITVGLAYLSLDRTLPSLSAGESQRVRLASLLGSGLTGVLYVLDEPTTGLHPHDNTKLLATLRLIQAAGNTVLIIEHDPDMIKQADYIIDMGPGGGSRGGEIVASGTPVMIATATQSATGKYLTPEAVTSARTITNNSAHPEFLTVHGAQAHNLKNITVAIPTNQLVVLTGVSGSGKSTCLFDILDKAARNYLHRAHETPGQHAAITGLEQFSRVITVDQTTIGSRSVRSNVATYTKLFDLIRELFAALPAAKQQGFTADKFSFNVSEERCDNCNGAGVVDVDLAFMPEIETVCPVCNGLRFSEQLLTVQFHGQHITQILELTVSEASKIFRSEKRIVAILQLLEQVGLGYLKLGQSTATLSGGEAQRIKLATELAKPETGSVLYLLDEPTTGLHPQEVEKLIAILQKLVAKGHTVITIEHNLTVISNADTIIDFGPGSGPAGGTVVAMGTPQQIAANEHSLTGRALKSYLAN